MATKRLLPPRAVEVEVIRFYLRSRVNLCTVLDVTAFIACCCSCPKTGPEILSEAVEWMTPISMLSQRLQHFFPLGRCTGKHRKTFGSLPSISAHSLEMCLEWEGGPRSVRVPEPTGAPFPLVIAPGTALPLRRTSPRVGYGNPRGRRQHGSGETSGTRLATKFARMSLLVRIGDTRYFSPVLCGG